MTAIRNRVPRSKWGARPRKCRTPQAPAVVRYLVVHYSAMDADEQDEHANCAARVRGIQRYHQESDQLAPGGACDIGYTWLVCRHGYTFVGRGWRTLPAATGAANAYTVAVCFLGNDTPGRRDVTPEARAAIRDLRGWVREHAPNFEGVRGHRDFMSTSCPGDELYALVRALNRGS